MTNSPVTMSLRPHRPGWRAWVMMIAAELRSVIRDTSGLLIPLGLPLLILVMYGLTGGDDPIDEFGGRTVLEVYGLPVALVMVLATVGIINMPSFLATYRRTGVLRRLAVTPASSLMVLACQVITSVLQSAVGIALALVVAAFAFTLSAPASVPLVVLSVILGAAALYAVGMVIGAVAPTPNAAIAIGLVAFFAIGALGGMFAPRENLPSALANVGEWLPFGTASEAVREAWVEGSVNPWYLVALAVTAVVGALIGSRFFRWDR